MIRLPVIFLICGLLWLILLPCPALGEGCFYPTSGYMFYLGGNAGDLENAPSFGARLEYNSSPHHVHAVGLVYQFSHHTMRDPFGPATVDQHFCLIGYRIARNWNWVQLGSHVGTGAIVRDFSREPQKASKVAYAIQFGLNLSFRPLPWLYVGPDATFLMTTDMDKWIFGGRSSYFFNLGGHVALDF